MVDHLSVWTIDAIAKRLGRTRKSVVQWCQRNGQYPTRQQWVTSGQAAELTGWSPQWIVRLVKAGKLRGRRVPGGRWWLIDPDSLPRRPEWRVLKPWHERDKAVRVRGEAA